MALTSRAAPRTAFSYGLDPGVMSLTVLAQVIWVLGFQSKRGGGGKKLCCLLVRYHHPMSLILV